MSHCTSLAQMPAGVMDPPISKDFSVLDCFKNINYMGSWKVDSLRPNYVLKGMRIWRTVNLENKQNAVLFNSNNKCVEIGLFEIIKFGLFEKKLNAFLSDDFNETGQSLLSSSQILQILALHDTSEVSSFDANGNSVSEKIIVNRYLTGADIKGYMIKEDWVTNNFTGKLEKYVIAIAPIFYNRRQEKFLPLFWLYYPEWKELLSSFEAKNYYSYERTSFKDVFEKKYFISVISKENNVFDRGLKKYQHGDDAYLESERIKENLYNSESDLFQH